MASLFSICACLQVKLTGPAPRRCAVLLVALLPCQSLAQYTEILKQVEDAIDEVSDGYPQQRRTEAEKQKLMDAQKLGTETLRLGTQFTAPNIVGGISGPWGVARGYSKKLQGVSVKELSNETLEQQMRTKRGRSQEEADQACIQRRGSALICRNGFR